MLCGIDEAGRGPIAGPLVVAGVVLEKEVLGLNDSKVLSEKKREQLFPLILENSKNHIVFKTSQEIDDKGISVCLKESILEIIEKLKPYANEFLMDGNTSFGIENLNYLVKADATIPEVSAASILAKVSRDRFMMNIAEQYPNYGFRKHKGYGTKAHIEEIKKFGKCDIHRFSFKLKALGEDNLESTKSLF